MKPSMELVLGAGGVKGYFHIGLLKALEEAGIDVSKLTAVSVGAIVGALWTNGMPSQGILDLFLKAQGKTGNPLLLANSVEDSVVMLPDAYSFMVGWSFVSLERPWAEAVKDLGIKPNDRLRIVACDARTKKAVVFEGKDYDLATALSASGSLPQVFLPVRYKDQLLIDGAAYHRNPDEFCSSPAIISALGFAKTWPHEPLDPLSAYFHWRELYFPIIRQETKVDDKRNILIHHEADDVCGLSFALSKERCLQMVNDGYERTKRVLAECVADGRIKLSAD